MLGINSVTYAAGDAAGSTALGNDVGPIATGDAY